MSTGPFTDLREYMTALEDRGLLHRVTAPVDWDLEIGAIQRIVFDRFGPALLFTAVRDSSIPLASGLMATPERYALGIGCEPTMRAIIEKIRDIAGTMLEPRLVDRAACQENVIQGDDIDLFSLPVPKWHEHDGGRYLGTLGLVITRDPETGRRNIGIYREQITGPNKLALCATQQTGIIFRKYQRLGQPMPVVTAVGVDPCTLAASVLPLPLDDDEFAAAGGFLGEPLELVRCVTQDLEAPANAEFVFEGEIHPDAPLIDEGPFGEYAGYYGDPTKQPEVTITAITHRNDPVFVGTLEGAPPTESRMLQVACNSAMLARRFQTMKTPGVKDVYLTDMGCASYFTIVSLSAHHHQGYTRQVMEQAWAYDSESKWIIVVDDDIDIYDRGQVEWALATRVQPHRDIWITPNNQPAFALDPSIAPENRGGLGGVRGSRIGIDATTKFKGFEFGRLERATNIEPVLERWDELGIP
jgi:UbiD family decarboxylase